MAHNLCVSFLMKIKVNPESDTILLGKAMKIIENRCGRVEKSVLDYLDYC